MGVMHGTGMYGNVPEVQQMCESCGRVCDELLAAYGTESSGPSEADWVCKQCIVGRNTKIFWPVNEEWYIAAVVAYHRVSGAHLVQYSDGANEWMDLQTSARKNAVSASSSGVLG